MLAKEGIDSYAQPFARTTLIYARCSSCISIGLSRGETSANRHAGSDMNSWSWLGAEAKKAHDSHRDPYAQNQKVGTGDVMGCAYYFETGQIFFTLNGRSLGKDAILPDLLYSR